MDSDDKKACDYFDVNYICIDKDAINLHAAKTLNYCLEQLSTIAAQKD